MANHYIVMGDILKSRAYDGRKLMLAFKALVSSCNEKFRDGIISPYTITLGDEFQGIAENLHAAVQSLLFLEESTWRTDFPFMMRFAVLYGEIETPLNRGIAYGMIGPGLTRARELLSRKRWGRIRFHFDLPSGELAAHLCRLFDVMASLKRDWRGDDAALIMKMLASDDDAEVGAAFGKNRSQIWKRRKNLHINDFNALKEMSLELSKGKGA